MKRKIDPLKLIHEMISQQKKTLLKTAKQLVPTVTPDDLWQPNDFPELEESPEFRYEEGVLAGLLSFQSALQAEAFRNEEG